MIAFKLPELGENIKAGDVVKINVAVGDVIKKDQAVLELETDKAVVEVPSHLSGVVREVLVKVGEKAKVGQNVFMIESDAPAANTAPKVASTPAPASAPEIPAPAKQEVQKTESPILQMPAQKTNEGSNSAALAAPSVRKLAREIGVDIDDVAGSGPQGRITLEDVKAGARRRPAGTSGPDAINGTALNRGPNAIDGTALNRGTEVTSDNIGYTAPKTTENITSSDFGKVERKPFTNVRRKTAERMTMAWTTIPHVTQHDDADITELENLRKQFGKRVEAAGGHLTVTAIVLKIIASALKVFPQFNASIDMESQEIIYKKYFHIGVAVDTDRGLLVPVIRDVDKKNIIKISADINAAAERARNKKTTLEEMSGGSFTVTNLGGIGGGHFTPIINAPEVAILGIGRWRYQQVYVNNAFEPRKMLPISLSYDHRIIDGADAARFLRWIADAMTQPFLMDLEG